MRRILLFALCLGSLAATTRAGAPGPGDPYGNIAAAYLVKVDGREIWARNPDRRLPPGSLTKMMTALLVLERGGLGEVATVSGAASRETGTRLGLAAGDRVTVVELLAAAVIGSANDACHVLAEHVSGSEEKFVARMNERALELGFSDTHFANACGHDDPGLYSTARDLARIAEAALRHPLYARIAGLVGGEIATADGSRTFTVENKNELIGRYRGAVGVKTGFTPRAGKCLVALAEREGRRVLLVLLNSPDRWWKAEEILDAAFRTAEGGPATPPK